jgi:hypothetical protein
LPVPSASDHLLNGSPEITRTRISGHGENSGLRVISARIRNKACDLKKFYGDPAGLDSQSGVTVGFAPRLLNDDPAGLKP